MVRRLYLVHCFLLLLALLVIVSRLDRKQTTSLAVNLQLCPSSSKQGYYSLKQYNVFKTIYPKYIQQASPRDWSEEIHKLEKQQNSKIVQSRLKHVKDSQISFTRNYAYEVT